MICLPPRKSNGVLSFARGEYHTYLANCGLIGKLHMTLDFEAGGLTFMLLEPARNTVDATDVMAEMDVDHV